MNIRVYTQWYPDGTHNYAFKTKNKREWGAYASLKEMAGHIKKDFLNFLFLFVPLLSGQKRITHFAHAQGFEFFEVSDDRKHKF